MTVSPRSIYFPLLCLTAVLSSNAAVQSCMDKHQVVGVLRQMEKFLKGQEVRFTEGLRIMKSKLATLQNSVSKMPQADQSAAPTACSSLEAPVHGTMFGSKYFVGHEIHFTCAQGYQLVGPSTRVCQENGSWSGIATVCKDMSVCASNPCQNGGTCVESVNQYKCTCPQKWSGFHCQHPTQTGGSNTPLYLCGRPGSGPTQTGGSNTPLYLRGRPGSGPTQTGGSNTPLYLHDRPGSGPTQTAPPEWSVVNDPAFSRKPRCAQVNRAQHCSCDAGFHMSGTSDNSICQDVNECEVYRLDQGGKLCVHECVNIPGSYHCSCPSGYKLLSDGRSCEDVDECLSQKHNCTNGTTCINTGGGFLCVSPECPRSHGHIHYVRTSPFQCERNPCPMDSRPCLLAPKTVSFHYLSLSSNLQTPATLFRMATATAPGRTGPDSLRFGILGGNSRGMFVMQRSDRQTGELILVQQLQGPQEISIDVDMSEYSERVFQAKHVAKVHILVSPFNF